MCLWCCLLLTALRHLDFTTQSAQQLYDMSTRQSPVGSSLLPQELRTLWKWKQSSSVCCMQQ